MAEVELLNAEEFPLFSLNGFLLIFRIPFFYERKISSGYPVFEIKK